MSALWPSLLAPSAHGDDSRCAVSASGVQIRFADGTERLCMTSGLWNASLGYGNARIADAIQEAVRRLSYGGVFRYENVDAREAADALTGFAGRERFSKVLFTTGGGPANELAMKLARQYQSLRGEPRRRLVIGLQGSFHGMTFGAFSLTGEDLGQEAYGADRRLVRHIPAGDSEALDNLFGRLGDQVAAVFLEPVSGSGTRKLPEAFVDQVLRARESHGFLLVADEVASGFARTGPMFASEAWTAAPDLLILSKALSNGTCATASVLVNHRVARAFQQHDATLVHAETGAGSAVSSAAIIATLSEMERLDVVSLAARTSSFLDAQLAKLGATTAGVLGVEGVGSFRTVKITHRGDAPIAADAVPGLVDTLRREGVVVHPGEGGIQLIPAFTYTAAEMESAFTRIAAGIHRWRANETAAA